MLQQTGQALKIKLFILTVKLYIITVMKKKEQKVFTLEELSGLVNMPRRTVRYYIQIELVDRPVGVGRGAHYNTRHLDQLLEIQKWQKVGLSLERIRELLGVGQDNQTPPPRPRQKGSVEVWTHVVIDDGIELTIDPKRTALTPEETQKFVTEIVNIYEQLCLEKEK